MTAIEARAATLSRRFNDLAYALREDPAASGERWSVCRVCDAEGDDPHDPRCPVRRIEGRVPAMPDAELAAIEARAAAAVDAIIADGSDRRGVLGLDGCDDDDIREEIVAAWRGIVAREIDAALRTERDQHAAAVAAAVRQERETCARLCEDRAAHLDAAQGDDEPDDADDEEMEGYGRFLEALHLDEAIRGRALAAPAATTGGA